MRRALAAAAVVAVAAVAAASAGRERIAAVQRWGYQLQGLPSRPSDALDLLVVDAVGDDRFRSAADVRALKRRAGRPDRLVLAYLSVGEAESYRWYWHKSWDKSPPPFVAAENPEWRDNYKVRYWDPAWQLILVEYLDRILAAGFDGAYLDIIDAYEYFGPDGPRPERKTAAADMSALVARLAAHARAAQPGFLVVPQNGATLLARLGGDGAKRYLDVIDAIGAEDTFFFGRRRENNALEVQTETLAALRRFRDAGKPVLAVEYLTDAAKIKKFVELARAQRFVPCVARRKLDRLVELED